MPYHQVYTPAPKDFSIEVVQELPEGIVEQHRSFLGHLREARGEGKRWLEVYTYCRHCKGWVKAASNMYSINTLDTRSLSGRNGQEYYCARCGEQLAFLGMMS